MSAVAVQVGTESPSTEGFIGRIPVRNLWLLMLYASDLFRTRGIGNVGLFVVGGVDGRHQHRYLTRRSGHIGLGDSQLRAQWALIQLCNIHLFTSTDH